MLGLTILRLDPVIPKGKIVLNVGLTILRLDPVIPKGNIVLNVDLVGLDPIILKGRIVQDDYVEIEHPEI